MGHKITFLGLALAGLTLVPTHPAIGAEPFDNIEILGQLLSGTPSQFLVYQLAQRRITSKPDAPLISVLRQIPSSDALVAALRSAKTTKAKGRARPGAEEGGVFEHLVRAVEPALQARWPEVEKESRAALNLLPHRPILHEFLGAVLWQQRKGDEALAEFRESARIDPQRTRPHFLQGFVLSGMGNLNGAAEE